MTKPRSPTEHQHGIAKIELLMSHTGYCEETSGYVYGYRETCECGATRIMQYRTAADAADAHAHLEP